MGKHKQRRWIAVATRVSAGAIGAEVGVYDGRMSKALFMLIPALRLYMVDRWSEYTKEQIDGDPGATMTRYGRKVWKGIEAQARAVAGANAGATIIKGDSVEAAATIADASLDFVFIDGDHSYEGVKRDIEAWMPKVKPGGWLMGHDYPQRAGVKRAVDELGIKVETDRDNVWGVKL